MSYYSLSWACHKDCLIRKRFQLSHHRQWERCLHCSALQPQDVLGLKKLMLFFRHIPGNKFNPGVSCDIPALAVLLGKESSLSMGAACRAQARTSPTRSPTLPVWRWWDVWYLIQMIHFCEIWFIFLLGWKYYLFYILLHGIFFYNLYFCLSVHKRKNFNAFM